MLTKYQITDAERAKEVHLFIGSRTTPLTAESLTDQEAEIIKSNYPDTYGKWIEEIPVSIPPSKVKTDKTPNQ